MLAFRPHIERAIALRGSQAKLANEIGRSQQYISWLLKEAEQVSAEVAMEIERATDGGVKAAELRPDLPWPQTAPEPERTS
jgi:DNA-binding transcriptional regulator YdaS (Cro superfamily)